MLIGSKKVPFYNTPVLHLNGSGLDFVECYKYLGCLFSNNMSDVEDIKRQTRSLCVRTNMLIRKFALCSNDVKVKLFTTFGQNLYCGHLWSRSDLKSMEKLRITDNNGLRLLLRQCKFCRASAMFVKNNVLSLNEYIRKTIYGFKTRIQNTSNDLVRTVRDLMIYDSSLSRRWVNMLYS